MAVVKKNLTGLWSYIKETEFGCLDICTKSCLKIYDILK